MKFGGGAIRVNKCGFLGVAAFIFMLYLYIYYSKSTLTLTTSSSLQHKSKNVNPNQLSLRELLMTAVYLAEKGGQEVVQVHENGPENLGEELKGKTEEGAMDRVTKGDFRSHRVMYYGMKKAFPNIKVISEEHTEAPTDLSEVIMGPSPFNHPSITQVLLHDRLVDANSISVWIDPLDATQEFTENLVKYVTTMICVAHEGRPILGVIHRPFSQETFWSVVDLGNSPNLELMLTERERKGSTDPLRIIVSRSHAGAVHNLTRAVLPESHINIISAAGSGYKVLEVAGGRADVYLHVTTIKKWDLCAGHAILRGLGGEMTTVGGETLDYSAHTNPSNVKGILAYLSPFPAIEKLNEIQLED